MPFRKETDPTGILPGDFLILQVPGNRALPPGEHIAEVSVSLISPTRKVLSLVVPGQEERQIGIRFCIPLVGRPLPDTGFLAADTLPVAFTHQHNLERRLAESIRIAQRKKEKR